MAKAFVKDVCVVFKGNKLEKLVKVLLLVATWKLATNAATTVNQSTGAALQIKQSYYSY